MSRRNRKKKNKTSAVDQGNWMMCSICNHELKEKNFEKHLLKMHDLTYSEFRSRRKKKGVFWGLSIGLVLVVILIGAFVVLYNPSTGAEIEEYSIDKGTGEVRLNDDADLNVKRAADFTAKDVVTGKSIRLQDYRGSKVILNFVNYGCSPDVNEVVSEELLIMKELQSERTDFQIISVFCGCCPEDTLIGFATDNGLDWPWILDTDYSVIEKYSDYVGTYGYPTMLFIDRDGYIQVNGGFMSKDVVATNLDLMN